MNQSTQASSQDNTDKKQLAEGELAYEFFQPVFELTLNYQFASATADSTASQSITTAATTPVAPMAPLPPLAPLAPLAPISSPIAKTSVRPAAPITQVVAVAQVAQVAPIAPIAQTAPVAPVATLPASVSNCIDAAFSSKSPNIELQTADSLAAQAQSAGSADKQVIDDSGAVISFGRWNIRPHRIRYPDKSVAEFEYDESELLVRVKDRDGMEWIRITQPDHQNISTWKSSDGQTCDISIVVIADGTYQCISSTGVIQTCTTTGRIVVWTPFTAGFDLKRTLFAIFRKIDKNQDSCLSKEELQSASRQIWQESDAVQLIAMLQAHYDAICTSRRHALCRQGSGITIDDILAFDTMTTSEQEFRSTAPPHAVSVVRTIFDELNISGEGAVTLNQVRIAYDKRHERDSVSRTILQTLYEDLRREYETNNSSFAGKASNLTRSDLIQHYKNGYKKEVRGQIKIAGWGTDECWQQGDTSTRTLYVDPANPMESIIPQAIKHVKGDLSMGTFTAVFESLIVQCPHLIVRMISQTNDGKYRVSFPGEPQKPITVDAPTSNLLTDYIHGSKFGYWMAVIEDAYRQYENNYAGPADLDHMQTVERICRLLNGQSGRWIETKNVRLSDLGNSVRDVFKQRRVMVAVGLQNSPRVAGHRFISRSAVCGIVNFDHRNGRITVNDPVRDNAADSTGDPSNRNADGSTTLALSAFTEAFDRIYVEDWLPSEDMFQK